MKYPLSRQRSRQFWLKKKESSDYGVALISRMDKILGLFCKRALYKRRYSAKETYNFINPTDRSHPIMYRNPTIGNTLFGRMDGSCHTLPRVMSRVCMSHVTHTHNCYLYNKLQHAATRCNALQSTATHCSTLQHTAAHCNILRHTATHCNTLQQTAIYCNTLRHTAAHCSTLQSHI